ncbi:hypothetical protein A5733_02090 [Mycobacterium sp. NS-7484]|nr:hypothetical protein A5733_02090 [Mycobacterium sp. NS-7484]
MATTTLIEGGPARSILRRGTEKLGIGEAEIAVDHCLWRIEYSGEIGAVGYHVTFYVASAEINRLSG